LINEVKEQLIILKCMLIMNIATAYRFYLLFQRATPIALWPLLLQCTQSGARYVESKALCYKTIYL